MGLVRAGGDLRIVVERPEDRVVEEVAFLHVHEGIDQTGRRNGFRLRISVGHAVEFDGGGVGADAVLGHGRGGRHLCGHNCVLGLDVRQVLGADAGRGRAFIAVPGEGGLTPAVTGRGDFISPDVGVFPFPEGHFCSVLAQAGGLAAGLGPDDGADLRVQRLLDGRVLVRREGSRGSAPVLRPFPGRLAPGVAGGGNGLRLRVRVGHAVKYDGGGVGPDAVRGRGGLLRYLLRDGGSLRFGMACVTLAGPSRLGAFIAVPGEDGLAPGVAQSRDHSLRGGDLVRGGRVREELAADGADPVFDAAVPGAGGRDRRVAGQRMLVRRSSVSAKPQTLQ